MELHGNLLFAGRYRLEARLGAGDIGEVWRAQDTRTSHPVAIKKHLRDDSVHTALKVYRKITAENK